MAGGRRTSFSCVFTTALLATLLLPEFLSAGPVVQKLKEDVGDTIEQTAVATASSRTRVRNRRNISWYKQHSDFWSWYKYFTDNGNTEAVQELDRVYLSYLQNKNRAESRRSYKAYLGHLGDIYKSCAESEDPNCVASYNRPKPKPAPVKACDPYKDPHCLYALLAKAKMAPVALPAPAPAPAKAPAPMYVRSSVPVKDPRSGYHYYSPTLQSFLSKEQKAELVRICGAEDVECLQYHLRAAYGYKPSAGPMPSYTHLGCDPKTDPNCKAQLVQKAPSGLYLRYPNCDPLRDPYCAYAASVLAPRAPAPPSPAGSCNPLYEDGCNPLTATKFATPPEEFKEEHRDEPAASMRAAPPAPEQHSDPYAMFRDAYASSNGNANGASDPYAMYRQASPQASPQANDPLAMYRQASPQASPQANDPLAMYREVIARAQANDPYAMYRQAAAAAQHRRPPPSPRQQYLAPPPHHEEATQEDRHPLGPRGKTKEGYECFVGYDKECTPLAPSQPRSGANRHTAYPAEAYEPHLNADRSRSGVLEPTDLDCDPEYDSNCRLRRYEPEEAPGTEPDLNAQPNHQGAEDHHSQGAAESHQQQEQYETEPYQSGQEEPYGAYPPHSQGMPSFVDMLRGYGDQYPEQAPAPMYERSPVPVKDRRSGYHDYSPAPMSFLSKEQKAELLRICGAEDVECLQYHLRAAYGYKPSTANANRPSDPYAMYRQASRQANDPLAMYRQASPQASPQANDPLAMYRQAIARAQANDPYAMYRQAAAAAQHRLPPPSPRQQYLAPPQEATQEYLGPRGKTKEGHECFVGYDKECTPLAPSQPRSGANRHTAYPAEAYEPHLNADGSRNGVLEPTDLDCDPEYDSNCRLRRYEPEEAPGTEPDLNAQPDHQEAEDQGDHHNQGAAESHQQQEQYETEPYQSGQEEPYGAYPPHSQGMPSFVDMLRGYGDQYPEQGDHKAYAADYRKK